MIGLNLLFDQKKKRRRIKKLLCGALLVLSLFFLLGLLPAGQTVRGNGEAGADNKSGKDALNESIYEQIGKLDLEAGDVVVDGSIDSMTYSDGTLAEKHSILGRLFR